MDERTEEIIKADFPCSQQTLQGTIAETIFRVIAERLGDKNLDVKNEIENERVFVTGDISDSMHVYQCKDDKITEIVTFKLEMPINQWRTSDGKYNCTAKVVLTWI